MKSEVGQGSTLWIELPLADNQGRAFLAGSMPNEELAAFLLSDFRFFAFKQARDIFVMANKGKDSKHCG